MIKEEYLKMIKGDDTIKLLEAISSYFYGCYQNAARGSEAKKRFHDWMCAIEDIERAIKEDADD